MYDRLTAAGLGLAAGASHYIKAQDMLATSPVKRAFMPQHTQRKVMDGFGQHARDLGLGSTPVQILANQVSPETLPIAMKFPQGISTAYPADVIPGAPAGAPVATINPNANRQWAAKALGGAIASETRLGKAINAVNTRFTNAVQRPMLSKALLASTVLAPLGLSAAIAGDNDFDEALLAAILPTTAVPLIKEAFDTYHGQRVLDKSGLPTSLGQRAKYAGNLVSMLAKPILAASAGNLVGNIFDEDIPSAQ
jgi:hypothetical protein